MNSTGFMKPILVAGIALLTVLQSSIATGEFNAPELAVAITGLVTAIVVYFLRNQSSGVLASTKAIGAAVIPLVSALIQGLVTGGFNTAELSTVAVGVISAILMYFVQNAPDVGDQASPASPRVT
jgi:hypothetical protein